MKNSNENNDFTANEALVLLNTAIWEFKTAAHNRANREFPPYPIEDDFEGHEKSAYHALILARQQIIKLLEIETILRYLELDFLISFDGVNWVILKEIDTDFSNNEHPYVVQAYPKYFGATISDALLKAYLSEREKKDIL